MMLKDVEMEGLVWAGGEGSSSRTQQGRDQEGQDLLRSVLAVVAGTGAGCHHQPVQRDRTPMGAAPFCKVRGQPRDGLGTPGLGGWGFNRERRTPGPGSSAPTPVKQGHLFQHQHDTTSSRGRASELGDRSIAWRSQGPSVLLAERWHPGTSDWEQLWSLEAGESRSACFRIQVLSI